MKCFPFVVALAALTPYAVCAQNQQFSDCHTLAAAGNFIGADEALVNGLVCKVRKVKGNSSSAPTEGRTDQESAALLGIIEPAVLRSKEKPKETPIGPRSTQQTTSGPAANDPAAGVRPQSSPVEPIHQKSLGEIARAYRDEARARITAVPEEGRATTLTPEAATKVHVSQPLPPQISPVEKPTLPATKQEAVAATPTILRTPVEAPLAAVNQPPAGAQPSSGKAQTTQVVASPAPEHAVKLETNSSLPVVTSVTNGRVQAAPQVETLRPAHTTPAKNPGTASPAATAVASSPGPRAATPLLAVGVSIASQPSAIDFPPQRHADIIEEDGAFKEGQMSTCVKNVSLGSMEKEKLFLAIPVWALTWYEKNQKKFPGICFSDSLMPGAHNYLIVFFPRGTPTAETDSSAKTSARTETIPVSGIGGFTTSYGSTWHYAYDRTVTTTIVSVSAEEAPHNQPSTALDATAYSEQGIPISRHSMTSIPKHNKELSTKSRKSNDVELPESGPLVGLLSRMVEDIAKL